MSKLLFNPSLTNLLLFINNIIQTYSIRMISYIKVLMITFLRIYTPHSLITVILKYSDFINNLFEFALCRRYLLYIGVTIKFGKYPGRLVAVFK